LPEALGGSLWDGLKATSISEVILLGAGALILVILVLTLIAALTAPQSSAAAREIVPLSSASNCFRASGAEKLAGLTVTASPSILPKVSLPLIRNSCPATKGPASRSKGQSFTGTQGNCLPSNTLKTASRDISFFPPPFWEANERPREMDGALSAGG
jgi:hypothetical protein